MEKETRYVGVKETLSYGLANAGQVFGYNLIAGGYLALFFTKVFEIPPAAVSTMILFLGIWDTVNDPLMGGIIDKTEALSFVCAVASRNNYDYAVCRSRNIGRCKIDDRKNHLYVCFLFHMGTVLYSR